MDTFSNLALLYAVKNLFRKNCCMYYEFCLWSQTFHSWLRIYFVKFFTVLNARGK